MAKPLKLDHIIEPQVVIWDVRRDKPAPGWVVGDIVYAGNHVEVVRRAAETPTVERNFGATPRFLEDDLGTYRLIMDTLYAVLRGEERSFPLDVTDQIAEWVAGWRCPWPFEPRSDEERRDVEEAIAAGAVPIEVGDVTYDAPGPGQITCEMTVMGQPGRVVAEVHDAPGERKRTRLIEAPLHALWPIPVIHAVHREILRLHRAGGYASP